VPTKPLNRTTTADWPALPFDELSATAATLHMWTEIVGKIRLERTPWTNHSWHVPFYVTSRGLGTSLIPYGGRALEIDFDFIEQRLVIQMTDGRRELIALEPRPVCEFYASVVDALARLDVHIRIHTTPSEVADGIPFERDTADRCYDGEVAARFWRALVQIDRVFKEFRARFIGKCSPVHFFWGSFDLAVTRFSGREAPSHPGGVPNFPDWVAREAYSHQVSSAGFWPGGAGLECPSFYSYAYPAGEGFHTSAVSPPDAYYAEALGESILPYDHVRGAASPVDVLLYFLQCTYEAAADTADWDRPVLEQILGPER